MAPDTLAPGVAAQRFYQSTGRAEVIAIDKTINHWNLYMPEITLRWQGFVFIRATGLYKFRTVCAGFSTLSLDGVLLLRSPAQPTASNVTNETLSLSMAAGFHSLALLFSEHDGAAGLMLQYAGPDTADRMVIVGADSLFHPRGPCILNTIPMSMNAPCEGPRWALGNAESCTLSCKAGYFANGLSSSTHHQVTCSGGVLSSPDARCELLRCSAPTVANASIHGSCLEGPLLESGAACTPVCAAGFRAQATGSLGTPSLSCSNGTLLGNFTCAPMNPCSAPMGLANAAERACAGGLATPHASSCEAACLPGFRADTNLTCQDGTFMPLTFDCVPLPPPPPPTPLPVVLPVVQVQKTPALPRTPSTMREHEEGSSALVQWVPLIAIPVLLAAAGALFVSACGLLGKKEPKYLSYSDEEDGSEEHLTRPGSQDSFSEASDDSPQRGNSRGQRSPTPSASRRGVAFSFDTESEMEGQFSRPSGMTASASSSGRPAASPPARSPPEASPPAWSPPSGSLMDADLPQFPGAEETPMSALGGEEPRRSPGLEPWGADDRQRRRPGALEASESFLSFRTGGNTPGGGSVRSLVAGTGGGTPGPQPVHQHKQQAPSKMSFAEPFPAERRKEAMKWAADTSMKLSTSTTLGGNRPREPPQPPRQAPPPEEQAQRRQELSGAVTSQERILGSSWQPLASAPPPGSRRGGGRGGGSSGGPPSAAGLLGSRGLGGDGLGGAPLRPWGP